MLSDPGAAVREVGPGRATRHAKAMNLLRRPEQKEQPGKSCKPNSVCSGIEPRRRVSFV
jgi:hypothetical protein